jgi:hypothetical protein
VRPNFALIVQFIQDHEKRPKECNKIVEAHRSHAARRERIEAFTSRAARVCASCGFRSLGSSLRPRAYS